jgi:hypothetical protein
MNDVYSQPPELVLGTRLNKRVPEAAQRLQRAEVVDILRRLRSQPGVILADEVGMGKTFVALAVAYGVAVRSPRGPVIAMVPANLVAKWEQDLKTFCDLYLVDRRPVLKGSTARKDFTDPTAFRYGVARHSVELMKLLDDPYRERCHMIFLAQGAMSRSQTDKWVRLALIAEALRRHGRGKASRLIQVKRQIHRFLAELLWAIGEEKAHGWGEELWQSLLSTDPRAWKGIYNSAVRDEQRRLVDDPVPKSILRALDRIELKPLAEALKQMPVKARGGDERVSERLDAVRRILRHIEDELWKGLLTQTRWRSPLLVMDEAHHLKNPGTALAKQLQSPDSQEDLHTGDGAMAKAFDRMLFLTATPFQLGHQELVHVLERFGDVRWDAGALGDQEDFQRHLEELGQQLNESQRTAIALQKAWGRLCPEDCGDDVNAWWEDLLRSPRESLTNQQCAVVDAYDAAKRCRVSAEKALRPWIVRHNKGAQWAGTDIVRRQRVDGAAVAGYGDSGGLPIPPAQLLPFFLAARSAASRNQDLLGEALCSSYEAFRFTRQNRVAGRDEQDEMPDAAADLSHSRWYLDEFDRALERCSGSTHPKVDATVRRVVDLWETGEKVLVFAFYRRTCGALRIHISHEVERRLNVGARLRLREAGQDSNPRDIERLLRRTQKRFFDDPSLPGRRAVDAALGEIVQARAVSLDKAGWTSDHRAALTDVMRRFLRVGSTLLRSFPLAELDSLNPTEAVGRTLNHADFSGLSWRQKFDGFIQFLADTCSPQEGTLYLEAAQSPRGIWVESSEDAEGGTDPYARERTLANVRMATGETKREIRARLMRAFNTPFFPDILVCSEVMGEGVDLQRSCRHVLHHDLDWNPSSIEQRTGRVDRLGCKAEGRHPIVVYLPYLAGTADERQYRVMCDRERWFRVVMGQDEVARLITEDSSSAVPLPGVISDSLSFQLGISGFAG